MTVDLRRLTGQTVLLGYGRVGRRTGEALIANDIDRGGGRQPGNCRGFTRKNVPAVFGNASEPGVLIQAHIHKASMLVIATPDSTEARRMARIARAVNPHIEIVVRTHSEEEAVLLEKGFSGKVFMGEHELAIAATRYVPGDTPLPLMMILSCIQDSQN